MFPRDALRLSDVRSGEGRECAVCIWVRISFDVALETNIGRRDGEGQPTLEIESRA
jgi:hypothetical protein